MRADRHGSVVSPIHVHSDKSVGVYYCRIVPTQGPRYSLPFSCLPPQAVAEKKRSQKSEVQKAYLKTLLDYLTHTKLTHAIDRSLLLIETMRESRGGGGGGGRVAKPEEFVRVYDILLQVSVCVCTQVCIHTWSSYTLDLNLWSARG